ncbi:MAG: DNA-directed RNA polymerase subunit beta' [Chloroflexi bacterium]|nr:DNA-directed RNA polymerase subunit beta' [Chloroflexota bacterium]
MLEFNDFNAIRISLASPEQIRSWSYGEVTKPETINYRTLKPEKDGLFCEKIFGPTKDFECYCGKYKRVRYKGIVCDKCGVEVARSKVRRERMGHIELACPVSHIWFVKGTPGGLALLLDISPRNLEQVIYFARFIITSVNEEERKRLLKELEQKIAVQQTISGKEITNKIGEIKGQLEGEVKNLESEMESQRSRLDSERSQLVKEVMDNVDATTEMINRLLGIQVAEDIKFYDHIIVSQGEVVSESCIAKVQQLAKQKVDETESKFDEIKIGISDLIDSRIEESQKVASDETEKLENSTSERDAKDSITAQIEEIQNIQSMTIITDAQYHDMRSKYGQMIKAGTGAEAILECMKLINLDSLSVLLHKEMHSTSGQRRKKATKRLKVVEAFRKSSNKPEWMIITVIPVLPPELRPMVQLDGGRFATSDLNDLYRRVINRNNRLRRLLVLGAPEIIVRNEKRMLQEAVDSLIDNGRRGRAITTSSNHKLKSLSDMLRGKQGRFRQNLLGKRVDYSGRSVIIVGPELKLHQCGLPKRMALELFKPFVMHRLVAMGKAQNIKSAKRIEEQGKAEVWDILEEVVKERPILLNRAPTLHRLGIQAFEPVLVEGSAIQLHPLVCTAFNADFDGDQMAVHVPLSQTAIKEARQSMLSIHNMLSPSSGDPVVSPTLDMVFGCYYLTIIKENGKGEGMIFSSFDEAKLAYDLGSVDLGAKIQARNEEGNLIKTTVGRIIFNEVVPKELGNYNKVFGKAQLKRLVADCHRILGEAATVKMLDNMKDIGFKFATKSGITMAITDIEVPPDKARILKEADRKIADAEKQYQRGMVTEQERYNTAVAVWSEATESMTSAIEKLLDHNGSVYMMATSGAKGNITQIRQMAGMRGLMTEPSGRIIDLPIKSSFRDGLSVLEYFISTHGARKGLADTALRTADSGYLTRRLIDVSQEVIILEEDCGTMTGIWLSESRDKEMLATLAERLIGRIVAVPVIHPETEEIIIDRNGEITEEISSKIIAAGINRVYVRSPLSCQAKRGICRICYGRSPATGLLVNMKEAVGVIAAQSIGEPGTQLTMRTFHTGGVAGVDITSGLPRVEEIFEARSPKGQAIISEIDGIVSVEQTDEGRRVKVTNAVLFKDEYNIPPGYNLVIEDGQQIDAGMALAQPVESSEGDKDKSAVVTSPIIATVGGKAVLSDGKVLIVYEERDERVYVLSNTSLMTVENGSKVIAGQELSKGPLNPQDILRIQGRESVQRYMVDEVQKVYRSQGVSINDKHIEVIVRKMLSKVRIDTSGDTFMLPTELIERAQYELKNAEVLEKGGQPATAQTALLGVTKASLSTDSFLSAASFQETTRVLTEAAVIGSTDKLRGLKENVIIGKLIPARCLPDEPKPKEIPEVELLKKSEIESEMDALLKIDSILQQDGIHIESSSDDDIVISPEDELDDGVSEPDHVEEE